MLLDIQDSRVDINNNFEYHFIGNYKFKIEPELESKIDSMLKNRKCILDKDIMQDVKLIGFKIDGQLIKYKGKKDKDGEFALNSADIIDNVSFS